MRRCTNRRRSKGGGGGVVRNPALGRKVGNLRCIQGGGGLREFSSLPLLGLFSSRTGQMAWGGVAPIRDPRHPSPRLFSFTYSLPTEARPLPPCDGRLSPDGGRAGLGGSAADGGPRASVHQAGGPPPARLYQVRAFCLLSFH